MNPMSQSEKPLWAYSLLAFPLAFLGIPLYLHLPTLYHEYYGLSLGTIGFILMGSRLFDAFIDPLIGVLSDQLGWTQKRFFLLFGMGLVICFNGFFYMPVFADFMSVPVYFAIFTVWTYLFLSLVLINYYHLGLYWATDERSQTRLASMRELFGFLGMIVACFTPFIFTLFVDSIQAYQMHGLLFGLCVIVSLYVLPDLRIQKTVHSQQGPTGGRALVQKLIYVWKQPQLRLLIMVFFINAIPIGITSNLFSFYVEQVLEQKKMMPVFLMVYLLSGVVGAISCQVWFKHSQKIRVLMGMMLVSIAGFSITYGLSAVNSVLFYGVCIISGIGLGGELVMLPALAAENLGAHQGYGNTFFSLWASSTKITLAMGAGIFLPLIAVGNGYSVSKIAFFYAVVPLCLKLVSIIILFFNRQRLSVLST